MGTSIGQIPADLVASRFSSTDTVRQAPSIPSRGREGSVRPAGQRDQKSVVRAGFGQGTISAPAAALITIGKGVQAARDLYPTPRELQAALRERFAQRRSETENRLEDRIGRRVESRLPDASARARRFIGDVNDAAEAVRARLDGSTPETRNDGVSIQIAGRNFPVERPETEPQPARIDDARRIRVDVLA